MQDSPLIYIVEDSKLYLTYVTKILTDHGYRVESAENGTAALAYLECSRPDIILLDIVLPDINGLEICKIVRSNPDLEDIPIIFLTSKTSPEDIEAGLRGGGSDYIAKPVNAVELLARTDNHYRFKKSSDTLKALNEELIKANETILKKNEELQKAMLQLEKYATTDPLTGLYNRRYILNKINDEVIRCKRNQKPFSIICCDIDYFKSINDAYGHDAGDLFLCEISKIIKSIVREQDIVGRWGGEEFLIFLPETNLDGACIVAEKIRKAVNFTQLNLGSFSIGTTLTLGVVEYDINLDINANIKNADIALYHGKANGKNKVVLYKNKEKIVASPQL